MYSTPRISVSELADFIGLTNQGIHKRIKAKSIDVQRSQNKFYLTHKAAKELLQPQCKQYKISTAVVKGGVGKTTLAENIGVRASLYGLQVLLVDLDQQANLTKGLGQSDAARSTPVMVDVITDNGEASDSIINVTEGVDLIPSRLDNVTLDTYMMLKRINPIDLFGRLYNGAVEKYDLIIFDCPPTLGALVCSAMSYSDLVIAPLNPDIYSYEGIDIMEKEVRTIKKEYGVTIDWRVLLNKFDSRTVLSTDYISQLLKDKKYSEKLLKSVIRTNQEFPNTKNKGRNLFDNLRKSNAKEDIDAVVKEIITNHMNVVFN